MAFRLENETPIDFEQCEVFRCVSPTPPHGGLLVRRVSPVGIKLPSVVTVRSSSIPQSELVAYPKNGLN